MDRLKDIREKLVKLMEISIPVSLVLGTIFGAASSGFDIFFGFHVARALLGAVIGLLTAALGAGVLAILIEILTSLRNIEAAQRRDG